GSSSVTPRGDAAPAGEGAQAQQPRGVTDDEPMGPQIGQQPVSRRLRISEPPADLRSRHRPVLQDREDRRAAVEDADLRRGLLSGVPHVRSFPHHHDTVTTASSLRRLTHHRKTIGPTMPTTMRMMIDRDTGRVIRGANEPPEIWSIRRKLSSSSGTSTSARIAGANGMPPLSMR